MALGYVTEPGYDDPDGASIIDPDGVGPAISFLRVPEPKTAKNRMHIDIRVAGEPPWDKVEREQLIRAKAAELVTAGATSVREESYDGEHLGHIVMLDPEGNEFWQEPLGDELVQPAHVDPWHIRGPAAGHRIRLPVVLESPVRCKEPGRRLLRAPERSTCALRRQLDMTPGLLAESTASRRTDKTPPRP